MVHHHTAGECLRAPLSDTLPLKCRQVKKAFGECRRGMIDMRKRFRGNQPVTFQTLQGSEAGQGYQLYGGKAAFSGSVKTTDGNEPAPKDWREEENEKYRQEQKNSKKP